MIHIEDAGNYKSPQSVLGVLPRGSRYLLESTLISSGHRWAVLGYGATDRFRSKGEHYWINDERFTGPAFDILSKRIAESQSPNAEFQDLPFLGGYIGCVSYEAARHLEQVPVHPPDAQSYDLFFYFAKTFYLFDLVDKRVYFVSSEGKISDLKEFFNLAKLDVSESSQPCAQDGMNFSSVQTNFSKDDYLEAIDKIQDYIRDGHSYQVNLSQRFTLPSACDPLEIYKTLSRLSPVPFAGFFEWEDTTILSGSPERLFSIENNSIRTRPIAGTRRCGSDEETKRFIEELSRDPKEKSEHAMLVDLSRNDLGRICKYGTVKVSQFMDIVPYKSIIHTESEIIGTLNENTGFLDVMRAVFPGGTITGVPKIRTMEIIQELEPCSRGIYTGSMGYWSLHGRADFNIMIRPIVCHGANAYTQAGGGITCKALPQREYQETLNKARAQLRAILIANGV